MTPLCQYLALLPSPVVDGAPLCLVVDAEVAGQVSQSWPQDGVSTLLSLPRSRLELGVAGAQHRARVAVTAARSGGLSSSTGINGEAIIPELQIAEVSWLGPGVLVAAGLIDDPWVVTGNADWGLRAAAPVLSEAVGWLDRSDLGASVAWRLPSGRLGAIATLTTGEGARFAERNNGKNTTVMIVARPLPSEVLAVSLMARDGSRGLDSARDHRAGARITAEVAPVRVGGELLMAWGVLGDIDRTPLGGSGWTEVDLLWDLSVFARGDLTIEEPGNSDSIAATYRGGVVWGPGPASVILGVAHTDLSDDVVDIAGAGAFAEQTRIYALLSIQQGGAVALEPL